MHKFKRNRLTLALVAAIGSIGIAGTVSAAVHLSDDGQGQVLIYPYYTTRAGNDTYLSVLNSTALSKALKFVSQKARMAARCIFSYLFPRMTSGLLRLSTRLMVQSLLPPTSPALLLRSLLVARIS
ncbi:MAG: hypothetical protein IPP36_05910 [Nitrosomonadales bacterium]|nr:hypothetical protein [Nitrosomonadales bacterium]